ncbi:hypothetical protein ACEQPO_12970 [Bacillus sp. SL00103]
MKVVALEVMAKRGKKTMLFGPMKPVGLEDPENRKKTLRCCSIKTR